MSPSVFKKPRFQFLFLFSLTLYCYAFFLPNIFPKFPSDFYRYWATFQMLRSGHNPFDLVSLTAFTGYDGWHAPAYAFPWFYTVAAPILWPSFSISFYLWMAVNTFFYFSILEKTWRWLKGDDCPWILLFLATFFYLPLVFNFHMGQLSLCAAYGLISCLVSLKSKRQIQAGIFLSLAMVKPHPIYLVLFCLVLWGVKNRKYSFLFSFLLFQLGLVLLTETVSPGILQHWFEVIGKASEAKTSTLPALLQLLIGKHFGIGKQWILSVIPALVIIGTGYFFRKREIDWVWHLPILLILSVFTAPYGFVFDFSVLVIVLVMIVHDALPRGDRNILFLRIGALHILLWGLWIVLLPSQYEFAWVPPLTLWVWSRNSFRELS